MDTHPFVPLAVRYQAALHRVIQDSAPGRGEQDAAGCFARCLDEARRLGLRGNALIVAAEHMAIGRLRQCVPAQASQLLPV